MLSRSINLDTLEIDNMTSAIPISIELFRNAAGEIIKRTFRGYEYLNIDDHFPVLRPFFTGKHEYTKTPINISKTRYLLFLFLISELCTPLLST